MSRALVYDVPAVAAFMRSLIPGLRTSEDMVAIGLQRNDRLVAGVLYEGINPFNAWMHVAVSPGFLWSSARTFLRACFAYPFEVCGVRRISGYVNETNERSMRLCQGLGFRPEAFLRGAATDGRGVVVMVMWRDECRFLKG